MWPLKQASSTQKTLEDARRLKTVCDAVQLTNHMQYRDNLCRTTRFDVRWPSLLKSYCTTVVPVPVLLITVIVEFSEYRYTVLFCTNLLPVPVITSYHIFLFFVNSNQATA